MNLDVRSCQLEGNRFEYVDAGRGAPVVFLHGALGDRRT
jgi:pimeloyl-ACP methyl ester carboxylesterase